MAEADNSEARLRAFEREAGMPSRRSATWSSLTLLPHSPLRGHLAAFKMLRRANALCSAHFVEPININVGGS